MKKNLPIIIIIVVFIAIVIGRNAILAMKFGQPPQQAPVVEVTSPKEMELQDSTAVVGRIVAKYSVNVQARVNGYLRARRFVEGTMVKKGQPLFVIEQDPYQYSAQQANADYANSKAVLVQAQKNLVRTKQLVDQDFISKAEYDRALADRDVAKADLASKKAKISQAQFDLSNTIVRAPVDGKIGVINITEGNLISPSSGILTTIVSTNPVFVTFNVKAEDYIAYKSAKSPDEKRFIEIELPDGTKYPIKGIENFSNNQVDETTGTIKLRATLENPNQVLIPGEFVNVRISSNKMKKRLILPLEAVLDSGNGKFVYVVDTKNTVQVRPVVLGQRLKNDWVVNEGLTLEDKVIVNGVQKVMPSVKVQIAKPIDTKAKGTNK